MKIPFLVARWEAWSSCVSDSSFEAVVSGVVQQVVRVEPFEVAGVVVPRLLRLNFLALGGRAISLLEYWIILFALLHFPFALVSGFVVQVVFAASNTLVDFGRNYPLKIFIFHTDSRKFTYIMSGWKILNIHQTMWAVETGGT